MACQFVGLVTFLLIILNFAGIGKFGLRAILHFTQNQKLNKEIELKFISLNPKNITAQTKFLKYLFLNPSKLYQDDDNMKKEILQCRFVFIFFIFSFIAIIILTSICS